MNENIVDEQKITQGLQKIRKRRSFFWFVFFGYIPFGLIAFSLFGDPVAGYLIVCWAGLFVVAGFMNVLSICPQCGHFFHRGLFWTNPFTKKCLRCGLPLPQQSGWLTSRSS